MIFTLQDAFEAVCRAGPISVVERGYPPARCMVDRREAVKFIMPGAVIRIRGYSSIDSDIM